MTARTRRPAVEAEAEAAQDLVTVEVPADTVVRTDRPQDVHRLDTRTLRERIADRQADVVTLTREELEQYAAQALTEYVANLRAEDFVPSDPGQTPVAVLFSRAMGEVGAISKDRRIEEGPQRYAFRGIEDVQQRLQPILVRHGLVILPETLERIDHPVRTTQRGGSMYAVALHVRFTVHGPAGDTLTMTAWGEGADSGDKASGKAHSMAYKTAMLEAFCIPTETDTPDADRTVPEATYSEEQRDRAGRAWQAALDCPDEPCLAAVRARAQHLLEVPVEIDGNTASLEERLRGRLAYLRQQATERPAENQAGDPA